MALFARPLLSRWGIALMHGLLIYILISAFSTEVVKMLYQPPPDLTVHEIHQLVIDTLEGLAVILIGYGVALEEREVLRDMSGLRLEPAQEAFEHQIDHLCHRAGLLLLLLGLFSEIALKLVEIPNAVINTASIETPVLTLSMLLQVLAIFVMLRHIWTLFFSESGHARQSSSA